MIRGERRHASVIPLRCSNFIAVVEEFEGKRQSGRPMLKPVVAVSEPLLDESSDRLVESGRVSTAVSEERIAALEESLKLIEARWRPAEPVGSVLRTHEKVQIDSVDR